ncbi:copper chaperone PCu(A)C [Microbacterium koreense]|uniref:Copper chaperone PCu(A)C n=1 Tax=Microbacterium koreense TaxID=323761 RepID=A0ABW2ZSG7_9MICO
MTTKTTTLTRLAALLAVGALALSGCASQSAPAAETMTEAESIEIVDTWVKSADEGMSAAFGELTNQGDTDITVVSAESEASTMLELHETSANDAGEMVMREIDGGFVIPAGGSLTLEPGGNHLMLMDLTAPLVAGSEATFILTLSDGSTFEFVAPVKDYSGANESYEGDHSEMDHDHDGHDHSDDEDEEMDH